MLKAMESGRMLRWQMREDWKPLAAQVLELPGFKSLTQATAHSRYRNDSSPTGALDMAEV